MSLHPSCEEKIMGLGNNESIRRSFVDLFRAVTNNAIVLGVPNATEVLLLYDEDSNLQPGDWAAEIHLVVRQVESVDGQENKEDHQHPRSQGQDDEGGKS